MQVVDHAGTHPDDDEDEQEEDDDDVRLRHVQRQGVPAHRAGLLVPAKPTVPDPVTDEGLVDAVGVVAVVEGVLVGTLIAVFHLLHLSEDGNKLGAEALLVSVEPEDGGGEDQWVLARALSPDVEDVRLTDVVVRHGATEILLPVLDIGFTVKYLDEVVVAVIGHLQVVFRELEVDVFPLLRPDDPGAVHGHRVGPGVVHLLAGDV